MTSRVIFSAKDHDEESTNFGVFVPTLTSANLDANVALIGALQAAVNGISLGTFDGEAIKVTEVPASAVPVDPYAQREAKWRVSYVDDATPLGNGSFEIGMPDLTLLAAGTKNMDLSAGAGLQFKTDFEAIAQSRLGNSVTVTKVTHVGRNL